MHERRPSSAYDSDDLEIVIEGRSISGSPTTASRSVATTAAPSEDEPLVIKEQPVEEEVDEPMPILGQKSPASSKLQAVHTPPSKPIVPATPPRRPRDSVWALPPERIANLGYVPKPERQVIREGGLSAVQIRSA